MVPRTYLNVSSCYYSSLDSFVLLILTFYVESSELCCNGLFNDDATAVRKLMCIVIHLYIKFLILDTNKNCSEMLLQQSRKLLLAHYLLN